MQGKEGGSSSSHVVANNEPSLPCRNDHVAVQRRDEPAVIFLHINPSVIFYLNISP
jgi:hypothetical protein